MDQALALIAEAKRTRATTLDLGNCGLTELPDLSGLPWLEELILSSEWSEFNLETLKWEDQESRNEPDYFHSRSREFSWLKKVDSGWAMVCVSNKCTFFA